VHQWVFLNSFNIRIEVALKITFPVTQSKNSRKKKIEIVQRMLNLTTIVEKSQEVKKPLTKE